MSHARPVDRSVPVEPTAVEMVGRQSDYWITNFRRTWRGSVVSSFLQPLLYVASMGILLGGYIDDAAGASESLGGLSYLAFVVPGLLAAHAMQLGTGEVMWPVLGAIKWDKTYLSMMATPLRVRDIAVGHLMSVAARLAISCAVFVAAMLPFRVFDSVPAALLTLLAGTLTGTSLACGMYAISVRVTDEMIYPLIFRIAIMPMFLFSGAFFPVSNLPDVLEWAAKVTPLYHGVELCRMASTSSWDSDAATVHLAYLVVLGAAGVWWGIRGLERRLAT